MSYFTPADAEYLKGSVRKIVQLTAIGGIGITQGHPMTADIIERDAEIARLFAFIDGCTLEKGKA